MRHSLLVLMLGASACTSDVAGGLSDDGAGDPDGDLGEDPGFGDPGGGLDDLCEADFQIVRLDPVPPTVQMLIDMSGSMHNRFGNTVRWDAVKYALTDPVEGVVPQLESEIYFGATLYHSVNGGAAGACALMRTESPRMNNLPGIVGLLDGANPREDTPTAEAVDAIAATLVPAAPSSQRYIVLATDGDPDTCVDPDNHTLEARVLAENAVDRAHAAGIKTLVLSVGNDITREHLRRTANLGAGEPVFTGDAPYYVANNPGELISELEALLMDTLPTCSFRLQGSLAEADAPAALIELNGRDLDFGIDWRWVDPQTIELVGAACDDVLADPTLPVHGTFRCDDAP